MVLSTGYTKYACGPLADSCVWETDQTNEQLSLWVWGPQLHHFLHIYNMKARATVWNHSASKDNQAQSSILGIGLLELLDNGYKLLTKFPLVPIAITTTPQPMAQNYGITAALLFPSFPKQTAFISWTITNDISKSSYNLRTGASLKLPCGPLCHADNCLLFLSLSLNTEPNRNPFMYPSLALNSQPCCLVPSGNRIRSMCKPVFSMSCFSKKGSNAYIPFPSQCLPVLQSSWWSVFLMAAHYPIPMSSGC